MPTTSQFNTSSMQTITNKYRYEVMFELILDSETSITLDSMYIKTIIIDYDYKKNTMPLIYLTVTLDNKILWKMINNNDTAVVIFTIRRFIANTNNENKTATETLNPNDIKTDYIKDRFIYFVPDNLNNREVNDDGQDMDSASGTNFVTTTIGLLSLDLVNKNKKTLSGIINHTPMMSLVYNLLSDRDLLMEQFKYNTILNGIVLPPLDSKAKTFNYLNQLSCFYDTKYRYFMDFDTTYFLSSSGRKIPKKNDKINDIIISIERLDENDSKMEGMDIDYENSVYRIHIGDSNSERIENTLINRSYSTIVAQGTSPDTSVTADLNTASESVIAKKRSTIRVPNDNTALVNNIKNEMDNSMKTILVTKSDLDMSIFTINKSYHVDATDTYGAEYNGEYLLTRKREIYIREDDTFTADVALTLNKIANSQIQVK